jgi:hypothetical protein
VGVNDVLVRYTPFGDADLDGRITTNDYFQIDSGFLAGRSGWINGDFDYDGRISTNDYFVIDGAFLTQANAGAPAPAPKTASIPTTFLPPREEENDPVREPLAVAMKL